MRSTTIYGVIDETTSELRYVGKTVHLLKKRLGDHLNPHGNTHRANWFRKAAAENRRLDIFEIEVVLSDRDWVEAEKFWIAYFRSLGARLLNTTPGGEGVSGVRHPELSKRNTSNRDDPTWSDKCKKAAVTRNNNPTWRESVGRSSKIRANTPKELARVSMLGKSNKGIPIKEETKMKMRATALKRGPLSEDVKRKIGAANSGREVSAETRRKLSAANTGRRHTKETIEHLREVNLRRIAQQRKNEINAV